MKRLLAVLGLLALLILTLQTLRHAYALWIEPQTTVMTKVGGKAKEDLAASKSLEELAALYKDAKRKREEAAKRAEESGKTTSLAVEQASKEETEIQQAIEAWEDHARQVVGLHFFWWCGLACIAAGAAFYRWVHGWVGSVLLISGFVAILVWTAPAFTALGARPEFERLLILKFAYSTAAWALLVGIWVYASRSVVLRQLASDGRATEAEQAVARPRREEARRGDGVLVP
jgi:hypothetical protein